MSRGADTYRAARRNAVLRPPKDENGKKRKPGVWRGVSTGEQPHPGARLNRSRNRRRATSYAHARTLAPFPERPVR